MNNVIIKSDYIQIMKAAEVSANINEFGVIAGSNKRRATLHDVTPLIQSITKSGYLLDQAICFIWSDDPRLEGYKTKAFKEVSFEYANVSDANNPTEAIDKFFDCLNGEVTKMNISYMKKDEPYKVILNGKRRLLAAAAADIYGYIPLVELPQSIRLEDYLSVVNPSLLNS